MPADRLFHQKAGHSHKVNMLTDLEYRVWTQYLLSADDFGVMRATAVKLQSDNDHLANRPAKVVQRCIEALIKAELVREFTHQGARFIFQPDWQDFQKVTWPAKTINPPIPADLLADCSEATRLLFSVHPGAKKVPAKNSGSTSEVLPENSEKTSEELSSSRARVRAERLTANANGSGLTAQGYGAPIIARRRLDAAYEFERVYVPQRKHADLLAAHGNEKELEAFYERIAEQWSSEGPYAKANPGDMFKFWQARYDEWKPPVAAQKPSNKPAWLRGA
jgi:hypothetical protein